MLDLAHLAAECAQRYVLTARIERQISIAEQIQQLGAHDVGTCNPRPLLLIIVVHNTPLDEAEHAGTAGASVASMDSTQQAYRADRALGVLEPDRTMMEDPALASARRAGACQPGIALVPSALDCLVCMIVALMVYQ